MYSFMFFFNDPATPEIYTYCHTLSLHDALPIWGVAEKTAGLVGEIDENRTRFEHADGRTAIGGIVIDDRGHPVVGGDFQEIGLELVAGTDVHRHNLVIEPGFLQEHRALVPVGRGPRMPIDHAAGSGSVDGIAGTWGNRSDEHTYEIQT